MRSSVFSNIVFCRFFVGAILLVLAAMLPTNTWGQDEEVIIDEINDLAQQEVEQRLRVYGNDMMGDQIDPATGSLIFNQTDVAIPGNFALPVSVSRKLTGESLQPEASNFFANWTMDLPRITQIVQTYNGGYESNGAYQWTDRCTAHTERASITVNYAVFDWDHISDGMSVNLPGQASGRILDNPDPNIWGAQTAPTKSTTAHLHISCIPEIGASNGGGEGFIAKTPDGTTYQFDKLHFIPTRSIKTKGATIDMLPTPTVFLQRKLAIVYATKVTDRFGNVVDYDYDNNGRLMKITASDGRKISFVYDSSADNNLNMAAITGSSNVNVPVSASNHLVTQVKVFDGHTNSTRVWNYEYGPADYTDGSSLAKKTLKRVVQPDGKAWEYDLDDLRTGVLSTGLANCDAPAIYQREISISHPYGVTGTFKLDKVVHGKTNVPHTILGQNTQTGEGCHVENHYVYKPTFKTMSVIEKRLSGPSFSSDEVWTYDYGTEFYTIREYGNADLPEGPADFKTTTVTDPIGNSIEYFHNRRWGPKSGQLAKEVRRNSGGEILETKENLYIINEALFGADYFEPSTSDQAATATSSYLLQSTTTRDGDTFTQASTYDVDANSAGYSYGNPLTQSVSSNVNTAPRETVTEYKHFTDKWILSLPEKLIINGREETRNAYNPDNGAVTHRYKYNKLEAAFGYHPNGKLEWIKDANMVADSGLGQYTINSWHRGIATLVTRPDMTTTSQVVDDNGWVITATSARGHMMEYEYDAMGRVEKVIAPKDTVQWDDTYINYNFGDEITQTITKGHAKTTVTYDNKFRPILEKTEDISGTGWVSYVNTAYDAAGQVTFKSQPSISANETKGTEYYYDGLGRQYRTVLNVDGTETTTNYGSNHSTTVTDAEGNQTTTWKNGFGEVVRIDQPEGTRTQLGRNQWGQILWVRQTDSNTGQYQVQYYVYDGQQRLCRHHTPSGGSSLFQYDPAGQLVTSSKGHSWANNCAAPNNNTGSLTTYLYDAMGRLETTDYADAQTGDIVREYDANGNITTLSRALGTSHENIWVYTYNELDLLTSETLSIDDKTFPLTYKYNPSGHMHDSMVINTPAYYDLDGLGRHTRLHRSYERSNWWTARNISYHVNGMLKHMDYANGHNLTQTLNDRQQLATMRGYRGSNAAVDLSYDYDARGLIKSITDLRDGNETRNFTYDGQGRLKTASGPWGTGQYNYDGLGNILSKSFSNWKDQGQRDVVMSYDNKNRVTGYTDSHGPDRLLDYDARGNVTTLGDLAFIYDAANQPRAKTNGTYIYDGNLKRVKSYDGNTGKTIYNVFSQYHGKPVHVAVYSANGLIQTKTYRYVAGKRITRFYHVTNTRGGTGYNTIYFHEDHLGSPLVSSNPNGSERWRESYSPYGEGLIDPADNKDQPGFTGHIKDSATGLNYMQARYYDPVMGRFLSIDPVDFVSSGYNPGFFNRYAYALNDPINLIDPSGESCTSADGTTTCVPEDTRFEEFSFPTPENWTDFESSDFSFHAYTQETDAGSGDADYESNLQDGLTQSPTPGDGAATESGNTIDVNIPGPFGKDNVKSYAKTDSDGDPYIANVTEPNHTLHSGFVVRQVQPNGNGGFKVVTYGEGNALKQKVPGASRFGAKPTWRRNSQAIIDKAGGK